MVLTRLAEMFCRLVGVAAWLGLLLVCIADVAVLRDGVAVSASVNASTPANGVCDRVQGIQCWGDDLRDIGPVTSFEQCCQACENLTGCMAWTWNSGIQGHCYLKSACSDRRAGDPRYESGFAPNPAPTPTPAPVPGGNPLNIQPNPRRSDNFFLLIGDWGKQGGAGQCQSRVAQMMRDYVWRQRSLGKKCLFIGAVGDNFYDVGLASDEQWYQQWADVYGVRDPQSPLYNIPWMAVMGNHDLGNADPGCACGQGCNQFNGAHRPVGTDLFWMPDYHWSYYVPGVDVEVIGLDTNARDVNGLGGNGGAGGASATFQRCGGAANIQSFLSGKQRDGEGLLDDRARSTTAKTVAILQHYDGPIGADYKARFEKGNSRAQVLSAYGHRHDQVCEGGQEKGCSVILTGGGGGYEGGTWFGFTAVHLTDDGDFRAVGPWPPGIGTGMATALLIAALFHAVAAVASGDTSVPAVTGRDLPGRAAPWWHLAWPGGKPSGVPLPPIENQTTHLHRGQKGQWCGPNICFTESGAHCFERHPAQYCMHVMYICVKYILTGCQLRPDERWEGDKELSLAEEAVLVPSGPGPGPVWRAASWSAAAAAAGAVAASVLLPAWRRGRAVRVDASPLLQEVGVLD